MPGVCDQPCGGADQQLRAVNEAVAFAEIQLLKVAVTPTSYAVPLASGPSVCVVVVAGSEACRCDVPPELRAKFWPVPYVDVEGVQVVVAQGDDGGCRAMS